MTSLKVAKIMFTSLNISGIKSLPPNPSEIKCTKTSNSLGARVLKRSTREIKLLDYKNYAI